MVAEQGFQNYGYYQSSLHVNYLPNYILEHIIHNYYVIVIFIAETIEEIQRVR